MKLAVVTRRQSELVKLRRQMAGKTLPGKHRTASAVSPMNFHASPRAAQTGVVTRVKGVHPDREGAIKRVAGQENILRPVFATRLMKPRSGEFATLQFAYFPSFLFSLLYAAE